MNTVPDKCPFCESPIMIREIMLLTRRLNAANERIARLEEAGDALKDEAWPTMFDSDASRKRRMGAIDGWTAAKEAKP